MAEKDYVLERLLEDKERFADLFNAGLFKGKQILRADILQPVSVKSGIVYVDKEGKKRTLQRYRDVIMEADFGAYFALFACESQVEVHYAMPVRCMLYDALSYTDQIRGLEKIHKEEGDKMTGAEFLSGMKKGDRIVPVFSVVLYLGKDEWNGSRSLYEMMGACGEGRQEIFHELREYLPDYQINLIHARRVEDIEAFRTGLQYFFGMLKYSKDKEELYQYVQEHREEIRNLDDASMMAALVMLGEQKRMVRLLEEAVEKEEEFDMVNVIDELLADREEKAEKKGEERGEKRGEENFALLTERLLKASRNDDLLRAAADKDFRKELYKEFGITASSVKDLS